MSVNVGDVVIGLRGDVARLQADMNEAKKVVGSAMKDIEQYVGYAKTAFVALGGVLSLEAFKNTITGAIEAKAKLYDLSTQTGINVTALGALGKTGKLTQTTLEDIAGASNKLSKAIETQNEDSKGAAQAISALGLNFVQFKQLKPEEQLLAVAKAMAQFEDGTGKTAAAMLLFGKTGATLLPFLRDLAERTELNSKQTAEAAKQAKEFENNLKSLKSAGDEWKGALADELLPTLLRWSNALIDAKKAYGGWFAAMVDSVGQNPFTSLETKLKDTQEQLGKLRSALQQGSAGEVQGAAEGVYQGIEAGNDALKAQISLLEKRESFLQKSMIRAGDLPGVDDYSSGFPKPKVTGLGGGGGSGKPWKDRGQAYDEQVRAYNEELKEQKKLNDEIAKQQATALDDAFKSARAAGEETKAMQIRIVEYGKTTDELEALAQARMLDAAAQLEWKAQFAGNGDFADKQAEAWRQEAQAIRDNAAARRELAGLVKSDQTDPLRGMRRGLDAFLSDIERAGDATAQAVSSALHGLEDTTLAILRGRGGKQAAKQWVDSIISEVLRLEVIRPFLKSIFGGDSGGGGLGGLLGAIGSLFGGGGSTSQSGPTGGVDFSGVGFPLAQGTNRVPHDGFLARLHKDEAVVPAAYNPSASGGGGGRDVTLNVINNGAPATASVTQRQTDQGVILDLVLEAVAADIAGGGKVAKAAQGQWGLNRASGALRY